MASSFNIKAVFNLKDQASESLAKIAKNMNPVYRNFRNMTANGGRMVGSLNKIIAPLGIVGGLAGGAFIKGITGAREYANNIADLTERLGVSSKFLQAQHYVAKMNASSAEDMNTALEKLSKQQGMLKTNTGALYAGLQKISPALLKQMQGAKGNEEAFNLMLKAIRKVEDPAKKLYLSQLAFGEAGKSMINIANQSDESLAALAKEAEESGIVMNNSTIKGAQELGDALTDMKAHTQGVFNQLASKLIPILIPFIKRITEWIKANKDLIGTKIEIFVKQFANLLSKIDLEKILNGISNLAGVCLRVTGFISGLNKVLLLLGVLIGSGVICNVIGLIISMKGFIQTTPGILKSIGTILKFIKVLSIGLFKLGIAFLSTPVGWICVGIAAIVAVFVLLWKKCEGFRNFWIKVWEYIKTSFKSAVDFIKQGIYAITHPLETLIKMFDKFKKIGSWALKKIGIDIGGEETNKNQEVKELPKTLSQVNNTNITSQNSQSEVVVKFDNLPKEAKVEQISSTGNTDLGVEYGYALGGT